MVSEIFSDICNSDHYLYQVLKQHYIVDAAAALLLVEFFLEILSERAAA